MGWLDDEQVLSSGVVMNRALLRRAEHEMDVLEGTYVPVLSLL